jgi:hypothetical protein
MKETDELVERGECIQKEMHEFIDKFMPLVEEKNKKRKNKITYHDMTVVYLVLKIAELEKKLENQHLITKN